MREQPGSLSVLSSIVDVARGGVASLRDIIVAAVGGVEDIEHETGNLVLASPRARWHLRRLQARLIGG